MEALQTFPVEKRPRADPGKKEGILSPTKAGKTMEELEVVARERRVRASLLKLFPHQMDTDNCKEPEQEKKKV